MTTMASIKKRQLGVTPCVFSDTQTHRVPGSLIMTLIFTSEQKYGSDFSKTFD